MPRDPLPRVPFDLPCSPIYDRTFFGPGRRIQTVPSDPVGLPIRWAGAPAAPPLAAGTAGTVRGVTVRTAGITETDGIVRGASMVEFESLEAAIEVAKGSPNLAFRGSVEVLEELGVSR